MHKFPADIDNAAEATFPLSVINNLCQIPKAPQRHAVYFCLSSMVERSWDETENVCTLDLTTPVCCTNLNFSIFCRAQRYKPVIKEWLEQKRVARSCNYMDHHHACFPRPTALHTLLPGISFVGQHISGISLNIINMQQWKGCSCFTSCL